MNVIETKSLCKVYGNVPRVNQLSLAVPEGSVYGFLGPNGAGKTTTLKMLLGLVHPTSGEMTIFSEKVTEKNRIKILRDIGSLIESPAFYGHLTVYENLQIIQTIRGVPEQNIGQVLSLVRLDGQRDKKAAALSLGMKQRLGIAAAMLAQPKLLILDEPTNGLDPAGIQEMRDLIRRLPEQYGMTVVVSSHLLSEIDKLATHVGIISHGKLMYQDTLENLHQKSEQHLALLTHNNPVAMSVLKQQKINCRMQEDRILLPVLNDEIIGSLSAFLSSQGLPVIRLEERQRSLEEIFLELTGGAQSL